MVNYRCKNCTWFDFRNPVLQGGRELSGYCRKKWPIVRQDSEGDYRGNWASSEVGATLPWRKYELVRIEVKIL